MITVVAFESASARTQQFSEETTSAIIDAQALLRLVIDAETGVRGYIVTQDLAFLQPYEYALATVPSSVQSLRSAVDDGMLSQSQAEAISNATIRIMTTLQSEVAMLGSGRRNAVLTGLKTTQKREMDAVRTAIGTQLKRWRVQRAAADASLRRTRTVVLEATVAASAAIVGALLFSWWFFGVGLIRRIETLSDNARRISRDEPLLPPMAGKDELARLDATIHGMNAAVRERETAMTRFRLIFEAARDAMVFIDFVSGKVVEANPAACAMYGYRHDEFVGLPCVLLRAPEARINLMNFLESAFEEGRSEDSIGIRKDGSTFPIEVTVKGTKALGTSLIVSVIRDATERQNTRRDLLVALDDAVRASRLKSDFVAGISHEIRTPMNGIVGMTDLLLRTTLDAEQRDYAETVRESAEALLRIINDILDFSKIEAGKIEIEAAAFDVRRLVESTAAIVGPNALRKGIGLMTFVDPRLPSLVRGDAGRLRQVLLNLAGNAIKFTTQGCVTLSVEPAGNQVVRFSVVDTGMGMSRDTLERLFKPFSQGDASTTRRYGGTGLGLSISQRLVELMGGTLEVESSEGVGSRFWFTLPLPVVSEGDGVVALRGRRCAIVVEDAIAREMLERYAKSWQMEVVASAEPDDRRFAGKFDVAIADARGLAVAQRVAVDRTIAIVDESSEADLRRGSAILRTPLTQSAAYEALDEAFAASRQKPVEQEEQEPLGVHVLLAEDNAVNQRVARKQLERLGCTVTIASTGREALEQLEDHLFDVVLMDCHMPEMDGFTATRALRQREANGASRLPVIALTAGAMEEDRLKCHAAGMDDFLSKPIELQSLRSAIQRWTRKETAV